MNASPSYALCSVLFLYVSINLVYNAFSEQAPGVPEIIRKSVNSCTVIEGPEMFIIGKHFQKDAKVLFEEFREDGSILWSTTVPHDADTFNNVSQGGVLMFIYS